jgi:L-cysteine desulfidase
MTLISPQHHFVGIEVHDVSNACGCSSKHRVAVAAAAAAAMVVIFPPPP